MTTAMLLAAGRGERLRPLTDRCPKTLIPLAGKPLIVYHLERLAAAGIQDVVINTAYLAAQLPAALGYGERWGLRLHYTVETPGELETAGGIKHALPLLGRAPFWVINADVFTDYDYARLPTTLPTQTQAHLVLVANPQHHLQGDFGLSEGRVIEHVSSRYTFSGIGVYHPQLFENLPPGRQPLGPLLHQAIASDQVSGELFSGLWWDIGTVERLRQAEQALGSGYKGNE